MAGTEETRFLAAYNSTGGGAMDGLGDWVQSIVLKGADIWATVQGQKTQADATVKAAQAQASTAPFTSKQFLYLGIGVVGAALLFSMAKHASRA